MGKMSAKYEEYKRGFHKDIERVYGSYKMTGTFTQTGYYLYELRKVYFTERKFK